MVFKYNFTSARKIMIIFHIFIILEKLWLFSYFIILKFLFVSNIIFLFWIRSYFEVSNISIKSIFNGMLNLQYLYLV